MPGQITTTNASVTLTPGFLAATTKSTNLLTFVSPNSGVTSAQLLSGTGLPSNSFIAQGGISTSAGTITIQQGSAAASNASATTSVSPTGLVTAGTSVISAVSSVSGILFGMPISGTGIPANATVVSYDPVGLTITMSTTATTTTTGTTSVNPTCFLTKGSNIITDLSSLTGLTPGAKVTGVGIPTGALITSVGSVNTAVMSVGASATTVTTAGTTINAILQSGNNLVTYVTPIPYATSFPSTLASGQLITDTQGNIAPNTTISGTSAGNFTITLSAPATGATAITALQSFTGTVVVSYEVISSIPASAFTGANALAVGQPIIGTNIPAQTIITAVNAAASTITINQFPTAALGPELTATSTPPAAFSVLATTQLITTTLQKIRVDTAVASEGLTIPTVEIVTPSLGTATLSQAPTGFTGTNTLIVEGTDNLDVLPNDPGTITFAGIVTNASSTVTQVSTVTGLAVGLLVSGPGIPAGATIATIVPPTTTTPPVPGSITLSAPATAGSTSATILAAYLPNSAALAAAGPALIAGTSPTVFGGFFDTAGASTSSSSNPAGSTFARTFSQVLAVLYGSTAPQTYEGGFFPNGVAGGINFV